MANRNRQTFEPKLASYKDLKAMEQHVEGLTAVLTNVIDRLALLEHAVSNIIGDMYYQDQPRPEPSMDDDVEDNTFEEEDDEEEPVEPEEEEETVEEEAARLRAERAEYDRLLAEADWENDGGSH